MVSDRLRRLIARNSGENAIREEAMIAGMEPLCADGLAKVKSGVTTAEELLRVVPEVRVLPWTCPDCNGSVEQDFLACPHCGHTLSGSCPSCHRVSQPAWSFCPHCATRIAAPKKKTRASASKTAKTRTAAAKTAKTRIVASKKTKTSRAASKKRKPRKVASRDEPA